MRGKSAHDPLREVTENTVPALCTAYDVDGISQSATAPQQVQAELLEAMNRLGPQAFDETEKETVMRCLIRALGIVDSVHGMETSFDVELAEKTMTVMDDEVTYTEEQVVVAAEGESATSDIPD